MVGAFIVGMNRRFDRLEPGFLRCVRRGGLAAQTAPDASLLCASLIEGEPLPDALRGVDPADFTRR